jgi:Zn-dependent protease with chaperone function
MRPRPSFQPRGLLLYLLTVAIELPVIVVRVLLVAFVGIIMGVAGGPALPSNVLFLVAVAPTLWSMFALISPAGSGWWWRQHTGGREPSQREQLAYQDAVGHLQAYSPEKPLPLPSSWFVVDEQQPDAGVCGDSLLLSRGLLEIDVAEVIGHELNHLGSMDGRLTLALNRLVIHQAPRPPKDPQDPNTEGPGVVDVVGNVHVTTKTINILASLIIFSWTARKILSFARGGLALRITAPLWGAYWREREYAADAYAASLGQAHELADFLQVHALPYDHPIPFIALTDTDHDFTELRIDKLRNHTPEPIANTAQPVTA